MDLCVNAITSTLKAFFKLLPDPLIPNELLPELLEIPGVWVGGADMGVVTS